MPEEWDPNSAPVDMDFLDAPVSIGERRPALQVLAVWSGFLIVVGIMAVGGGLASQMDRTELLSPPFHKFANVFLLY